MIFVLLFNALGNAETLKEKSFADYGLDNFINSDANTSKCFDLVFLREKTDLEKEKLNILSVHASYSPVKDKYSSISAATENEKLFEIKLTDFLNDWKRTIIPNEKLKEENRIIICANTTESTQIVRVLNDSSIGVYKTADFSKEDSFYSVVETTTPYVKKPINVTIAVRNFGSKPAEVYVNYWSAPHPKVELIGGETEFSGTIPAFNYERNLPGEKLIKYSIFINEETQLTLPAAILEFKNEFDETIKLRSNQPVIKVQKQAEKLNGIVLVDEKIKQIKEKGKAKILVKNNSDKILTNIAVYPVYSEGLKVEKQKIGLIEKINPNETIEFEMDLIAGEAGKYVVSCKLVYLDEQITEQNCNSTNIFYETEQIDNTIMVAGAFVAFAVAIYLFLSFKK